MQKISLSVFRLIVCGITVFGIYVNAQPVRRNDNLTASPCISEATLRVTASRSQINYGQSAVVNWSVELPSGCASVRIQLNGENVARNGSKNVSPPRSTTYTLTIIHNQSRPRAQVSESTRITVNYPDHVVIDANTREPVQVLLGALASNPVVIELCNVDLNLTGLSLEIGDNTSLVASPACARSLRNLGPRIFVTNNRGLNSPLFVIRGDNVLFSGFRLEGPTNGIGRGDDRLERGISIYPFSDTRPLRNVEISNMEIFNWSGAAIDIRDNTEQMERGRLFNTNENAVRIRNNFIHHNRHGSGNGYGVNVDDGAYALIEKNVFDENRHAIAGGSSNLKKDFSGYTARENLILANGGRHCNDSRWWALTGWMNWLRCWQTHQVDMHGDKSVSGYDACCGVAGETIIIQRNTILYDAGNAIKIRGNPGDKAVVDGNVFRGSTQSDAIAQNGNSINGDITNPIDVRPNNVFNAKPVEQLVGCDFDVDGKQDKFMASGVTWWLRSGETNQWHYLNTMPEQLAQLQFGDVDNDGKCDVALRPSSPAIPPRKYSKNGTGPWVATQVLEP
jgi:hypothetical protein